MKIIKRYDLDLEPEQKFKVPFNSEILGVDKTSGKPGLYILIDQDDKLVERSFVIVATDKEVPQRLNKTHYIGSFEHKAEVGSHLLHVFEER